MKVKSKLTPYPILFAYNDDYIDSQFEAEINADCKFGEIFVSVDFKLNNEEIEYLIDNNQACYTVHIECPSTSYRLKLESSSKNIEAKLDSKDLEDKIEVCTFIVVKESIDNYKNCKFHPDYQGYTFSLEKGNVLAIGTGKEFVVQKNDDDLENLPSIIKIVKNNDLKKGALSVDTDSPDFVLIGIYEGLYDMYYSLGKNKFKETIFSLVLLPALVVVLTRMKYAEEDEKEKKWFKVIESLMNSNNYQIEDLDIQNKDNSILAIAQMIFSDPISRSLKELNDMDFGG